MKTKWPPARLIGPTVRPELALEFIRRTDDAFRYCMTNDRQFERDFRTLIGNPDVHDMSVEQRREVWDRHQRFLERFGHVSLTYLDSNWIASAYIGGPHGPVSPSGMVQFAHNFGKWPSEEEIEEDLEAIANNFPWLSFKLSVHDNEYEDNDIGPPTHSWRLDKGKWERIEPEVLPVSAPDVLLNFLNGRRRETFWDITQIERLWGDQIRAALDPKE